jgi:hypothetical protein
MIARKKKKSLFLRPNVDVAHIATEAVCLELNNPTSDFPSLIPKDHITIQGVEKPQGNQVRLPLSRTITIGCPDQSGLSGDGVVSSRWQARRHPHYLGMQGTCIAYFK